MKKLAIVTTHPIQYNAPVFQLLNQRGLVNSKVYYTWGEQVLSKKYDPGFKRVVDWDIPLLEGYDYAFPKNVSNNAGSHHFAGIDNPGLATAIKQWGADALLVYGWNFKSHWQLLRYFKNRIPVFFRGDSTLLDDHTGWRWLARQLVLNYVYKKVDRAFYTGTENKKYFTRYGLKPAQLAWAPHAVDNERFSRASTDQRFREGLGISPDALVFLFAGKLEPKKDPLILLEAFSTLPAGEARLLFVGNGILESILQKTINNLPAATRERVIVLPFVNQQDMPGIYHACDVFILPSKGPGESWGLSVNEAMAAGRAVIVSDKCGCHTDLVKEGINGFVFPAGNAEALAEKMYNFIRQPELATLFGAQSTRMIGDHSFENICLAIENEMTNHGIFIQG